MRAMLLIWMLASAALGATLVARLLADDLLVDNVVADNVVDDNVVADNVVADNVVGRPRLVAPEAVDVAALMGSVTVFVLAVFVGFEIITKVPPTLHTPLMSGSNAISGITIVGALLVAGGAAAGGSRIWGGLAVLLASINVVGGFLVTHRMLAMFKKRG